MFYSIQFFFCLFFFLREKSDSKSKGVPLWLQEDGSTGKIHSNQDFTLYCKNLHAMIKLNSELLLL